MNCFGESEVMQTKVLKGNAVSPGVAIGPVYLYEKYSGEVQEAYCKPGSEADEQARFEKAQAKALRELDLLIAGCGDKEQAAIFVAHREMIEDEEILDMIAEDIKSSKTAEWAMYNAYSEFIDLMEKAPDALIAARAADLRDVRYRLLRILRKEQEQNLSALPRPCVIVAKDLFPSDTATLDRANVLAIVTEQGGATSHTAIIANSYRIPAVTGAENCTTLLPAKAIIGVDAVSGEVFLQPDEKERAALLEKREMHLKQQALHNGYLGKPAVLPDGTSYEIGINIGGAYSLDDFEYCDFVGLFRTEFLYMQSSNMPCEEQQYQAYCKVIEAARGRVLTLRTLDIGGDKTIPYMQLPEELNPFLGLRALRLCFAHPELLHIQLRAALRAAALGPIWIMLPMVGSMEDIYAAKAMVDEVKSELNTQGITYGKVKLGIMVEIPAIAAIADLAVAEVDFASIGTNDLCQYLSAADRMNPAVDSYYQSFSPAMVRTLDNVISVFNQAAKPVSVCGEIAGDPRGALLLCSLGLRKLSMDPSKIAGVKAALAGIKAQEMEILRVNVKNAVTQSEVIALLDKALTSQGR